MSSAGVFGVSLTIRHMCQYACENAVDVENKPPLKLNRASMFVFVDSNYMVVGYDVYVHFFSLEVNFIMRYMALVTFIMHLLNT